MKKLFLIFFLLSWPCFSFAKAGDAHYVAVLQAQIKATPEAGSDTSFVIAIGRKVIEFDRKKDWVWVGIDRSGGRDGWIRKDQLSKTDPDGLRY